jgi:hypothetical protein
MKSMLSSLTPTALIPVAAAAVLVAGMSSASSQALELPLSDCLAAVGTYLTANRDQSGGDDFVSRSLLSITNGGHMFFTDSGQGGEPGYAPFSDGRGAWRCVSNEDGVTRFVGSVLDFTYPPAGEQQRIGRLDIDAYFTQATEALSGTMTLYFVPVDGDPLDPARLDEDGTGSFTGKRVEAP